MSVAGVSQRWRERRCRWVPSGPAFTPARYSVGEISERDAAAFVTRHHYSRSWPSTTIRYGLTRHDDSELVGVLTLGVPMSNKVLTNPFPTLEPNRESMELNRLVLLDEVPANGESWFCARAFKAAAHRGVRGVVAFSDPIPRTIVEDGACREIKPGHLGIVYQALGFDALGRGTRRSLIMLPDGSVLTARARAKVTSRERGHQGVVERLQGLGAAPAPPQGSLGAWLAGSLDQIGARTVRHPGNYRYALRIGRTRAERTRTPIGMATTPYPKPHHGSG